MFFLLFEGNMISHVEAVLSNKNDNWHLLRLVYKDIDVDKEHPDFVKFITKLGKGKACTKLILIRNLIIKR